MRRFAISDIHGCADTFQKLLKQIRLQKEDELFLLGDYIDRGPDSKGVLDHIFALQDSGYAVHCLRGNHEQLLLNVLSDSSYWDNFMRSGGMHTLRSFSVSTPEAIEPVYLNFIQTLPHYLEIPDFILVHAGLGFEDGADPLSLTHDMLWIRNWYEHIRYDWLGTRYIVHGHTPVFPAAIQVQATRLRAFQYMGIDAGCAYIKHPEFGFLCALDLDAHTLSFQKNEEMPPD